KMTFGFSLQYRANFPTNPRIIAGLIGSAPQPRIRMQDRFQPSDSANRTRRVASANAKLGAKEIVARWRFIVLSQTDGGLTKRVVGMKTTGMPKNKGTKTKPMRPMS